jgi:uncharacterized protein YeaO (DUF488 family)
MDIYCFPFQCTAKAIPRQIGEHFSRNRILTDWYNNLKTGGGPEMVYQLKMKRIYEPPAREDGKRILVDRLWPRGVKKEQARLDEWMKEIAPSPELRRWFGHRSDRFEQFRVLYRKELAADPGRRQWVERICRYLQEDHVTLLYAAKDPIHNHAAVLREWVKHQCLDNP